MHRLSKALALAAVSLLAILAPESGAGSNLLLNNSFELNYFGNNALATNWNNSPHGGYWGSASRENWRYVSGAWQGTLRGRWTGTDYGGFWQEGAGEPGLAYEAFGWFFADFPGTFAGGPWTTAVQELKIEFYSSTFALLMVAQTNLGVVGEAFSQRTVRAVAPAGTAWARWVVAMSGASANGALQFDDVALTPLDKRDQDFNYFTNHLTDACFTQQTWVVCTGLTLSTVGGHLLARSGYCASLPNISAATDSVNAVRSPLYTSGVGTITFYYRHGHESPGTNPTNIVALSVEVSTNGTSWTAVGAVTNILSTNYLQFQQFLNAPAMRYARIRHAGGSTNRLLIDDISIAEPSNLRSFMDFNDWTSATTNWTHSLSGWEISTGSVGSADSYEGQSAHITGGTLGGSYLRSPLLSNGVGIVTFVYRAQTNTSAVGYVVETSTTGTNWLPIASATNIASTNYSDAYHYIYLATAAYVRIRHSGGTTTNGLVVDNVNVATPAIFRTQSFDTWPTKNSYGFSTYQGWELEDALVNTDAAYSGQSALMKDTVASNASIRSPLLVDGVGPITFKYVVDDTTPPNTVMYWIQTSPDATNWTTIDIVSGIVNQAYAEYSEYFSISNPLYVRLYHTTGASRVSFDDISILQPQPLPDVVINGFHTPTPPYTGDVVYLNCIVIPQHGASILSVTSYFRIGTSGAFTALGTKVTNGVLYSTTSGIPAQAIATIVEYYFQCNFSGPGAISPKFYPTGGTNDPTRYVIPRAQPGSVWVNEFNFVPFFFGDDTNEFIELAGPASTDLSGWRIDLVYGNDPANLYQAYANYTLPAGTVLSNDVNGHGFFVLGDAEILAGVDALFTNLASGIPMDNLSDGLPDAIRILNEVGEVEYKLSYNGAVPSYSGTGQKNAFNPSEFSLSLGGTGSTFASFTWGTNTMTPGSINVGQAFPASPGDPAPSAYVLRMSVGTNITLWVVGNSNNWEALPYYATNLTGAQTWEPVTPFSGTFAGGTNTLTFGRKLPPTNYYRVVLTNAP